MDVSGCPEGFFSDQLLVYETDCRQYLPGWITFAAFIGVLNLLDVTVIFFLWAKFYCNRRAYVQSKRKDFCCQTRLPVIPMLRTSFLILSLVFLLLASFNHVNYSNGSSVSVLVIALFPLYLYHFITAKSYLRLGLKSIPLAKRLMLNANPDQSVGTDSMAASDPKTNSTTRLTRTASLFSFTSAKDLSKISPISMSVLTRFILWFVATLVRSAICIIFIPIFPQRDEILTAAFAIQVFADLCVTFMISQLDKSIKALDGIIKTTSSASLGSGNVAVALGTESRRYLRVLQFIIAAQIFSTMGIHVALMIGYRSWYIALLEPASLSIFHVIHTFVIFNKTFRRKKKDIAVGAAGQGISPVKGRLPAQPASPGVPDNDPIIIHMPMQNVKGQRSLAKGVRSSNDGKTPTTADPEKQPPSF